MSEVHYKIEVRDETQVSGWKIVGARYLTKWQMKTVLKQLLAAGYDRDASIHVERYGKKHDLDYCENAVERRRFRMKLLRTELFA